MSDHDSIIEKIKKLLRMKRGGTAGEIENALALAAKLAREHGIDLNSVDPNEESKSQRITHVEDVLKCRLPLEARFAAAILVNFFNVEICIQRGVCHRLIKIPNKVTFVGTAWDCEIARYIFVFLQRHFRWSWNHRQNRRLKNREAFLHGMFLGLAAKLESQRPHEAGLILAGNARKDYLAKIKPNATDLNLAADDSSAMASKYAGMLAGRDTEIRSGLDTAAKTAAAIAAPRPALPPSAGQLALI